MSVVNDLLSFMDDPDGGATRDDLARRLFEDQCENIPEYERFCRGRDVKSISDVPAIPEIVYKGGRGPRRNEPAVKTFRSSGTSGSNRTVIDLSQAGLDLMNGSIVAAARRHLFPDGVRPAVLLLIPSPQEAPDVIMVYGMDLIARRFGAKPPVSFVGGGKIDFQGLVEALEREKAEDCPVFLAGGSFAFVHFLEFCQARQWSIELPPGSRTLDAGGFKGRSRSIRPDGLRRMVEERLGVPDHHQANLLGMTELASQIYDCDDRTLAQDGMEGFRVKKNDPWTDTTVVDPNSGKCVEDLGMLKHVDLAIYDRPCALLTADLGRPVAGGFVFVRRAAKVSHRGCSLTYEQLESQ